MSKVSVSVDRESLQPKTNYRSVALLRVLHGPYSLPPEGVGAQHPGVGAELPAVVICKAV